ncbi:MAG TPA: glycosyl hydrolase [Mycobacteriales bacterium]|nr:glycosyl hydrolase [Mycobacteriales bacterium]
MMSTLSVRRAVITAAVATGVLGAAGCASVTPGSIAAAHVHYIPADNPNFKINKSRLLHPKKKYFGISLAGVPQSVTSPIDTIKNEVGKRPNLDMYYMDWGTAAHAEAGVPNFDPGAAENACAAGMLPMLTWESWDTTDTNATQGVAYTQQAFSMNRIIDGDFDAYIKKTAQAIASIGCPLALRFDQEPNGYWYPWGVTNPTEKPLSDSIKQKAALYVRMWRHVHQIFTAAHATNVLWVWSPNIQSANGAKLVTFKQLYPGPSWVDWVGIDGYYNTPQRTFSTLFGSTIQQLIPVAPHKPWMLAETGVGSSSRKPWQIKNLLDSIAKAKRFNGLVYFEQHKSTDRSFWPFNDPAHPNSLPAFKKGIDQKVYASGKPGDAWYLK